MPQSHINHISKLAPGISDDHRYTVDLMIWTQTVILNSALHLYYPTYLSDQDLF